MQISNIKKYFTFSIPVQAGFIGKNTLFPHMLGHENSCILFYRFFSFVIVWSSQKCISHNFLVKTKLSKDCQNWHWDHIHMHKNLISDQSYVVSGRLRIDGIQYKRPTIYEIRKFVKMNLRSWRLWPTLV